MVCAFVLCNSSANIGRGKVTHINIRTSISTLPHTGFIMILACRKLSKQIELCAHTDGGVGLVDGTSWMGVVVAAGTCAVNNNIKSVIRHTLSCLKKYFAVSCEMR